MLNWWGANQLWCIFYIKILNGQQHRLYGIYETGRNTSCVKIQIWLTYSCQNFRQKLTLRSMRPALSKRLFVISVCTVRKTQFPERYLWLYCSSFIFDGIFADMCCASCFKMGTYKFMRGTWGPWNSLNCKNLHRKIICWAPIF